MVYVSARAGMDPGEISRSIGKSFEILEGFIKQNHVTVTGAPLAIYRDWNGTTMAVEVGFPVNAVDLAKAAGEVLAGKSPEGPAAHVVHKGSYASLRDTYEAIEQDLRKSGWKQTGLSWEVYVKGPGMAAEADYVTEIYMQLAQADMAATPAQQA
jgi:effector-binding domain-containing protein